MQELIADRLRWPVGGLRLLKAGAQALELGRVAQGRASGFLQRARLPRQNAGSAASAHAAEGFEPCYNLAGSLGGEIFAPPDQTYIDTISSRHAKHGSFTQLRLIKLL